MQMSHVNVKHCFFLSFMFHVSRVSLFICVICCVFFYMHTYLHVSFIKDV